MAFRVVLLISCLFVLAVNSYEFFQEAIPNGKAVPDPCTSGATVWQGVGHWNNLGSGPRNPFGDAFAANNYVWNRALCEMDSDQDGQTNGEELGDILCVWSMGNDPPRPATSHPGLCEPINSSRCIALNVGMYCNPAMKTRSGWVAKSS